MDAVIIVLLGCLLSKDGCGCCDHCVAGMPAVKGWMWML